MAAMEDPTTVAAVAVLLVLVLAVKVNESVRSTLQAFLFQGPKIDRPIHSCRLPHAHPSTYLLIYQAKGGAGGEIPAPVLKHVPDAVLKRKLKYKVRRL